MHTLLPEVHQRQAHCQRHRHVLDSNQDSRESRAVRRYIRPVKPTSAADRPTPPWLGNDLPQNVEHHH
jgi:hypothetical protein